MKNNARFWHQTYGTMKKIKAGATPTLADIVQLRQAVALAREPGDMAEIYAIGKARLLNGRPELAQQV